MHLTVLGLNHNTAPLDVREKIFIPEDQQADVLKKLRAEGIGEAAIISTCNRTEIYVSGPDAEEAESAITRTLVERFAVDRKSLHDYTYALTNEEAYKHLFIVASGLDSMVVGEPQILGQVKDAYRTAVTHRSSGPFFDRLFHRAFQVAKRVRTETRIGYNPVSISGMAVELARKIFGDLEQKKILVLGAGEMCEIALKHFKKEGLQEILVANRTFGKAQQLAEEIIGTPYPFEDIPELLLKVDMVLSSTGAEKPIIDRNMVLHAMKKRKNRPLFFIDIAVPRDVEPGVNDIENAYLYDIDDLKELSQIHLSNRLQESEKAHAIVDEEVGKFTSWLKQLDMNPLITEIRESLEAMRQAELRKTLQKMKDTDPETIKQIDMLTRAIVNKLVHPHIMMIKKNGSPAVLDLVKNLLLPREDDEKEMDSGNQGE
ncbi:MAG: Glutamyl-tRNA reductase [Syntrophorhabdaceae bacterium PtaU1.Bin034]|nr:MAG: Glutamyl-tRNA reductase [Syntrophorhabdaceae bacterium PtaU1.Bin034]